ncbi:MAG: hypothetical protein JO199_04640, partial [Candidatus Eremiobacteraeota bacterium]|nr:hypothetical protein [Candidatus Eremiobacteraeota bacterium]
AGLLGCAADAFDVEDNLFAAAFSAKSETIVNSSAKVTKQYTGPYFPRPFGTGFGQVGTLYSHSEIFSSDASAGTVNLIETCQSGCFSPQPKAGIPVITGLKVNNGKPGSILGPSGLAIDPNGCGTISRTKVCNGNLYVVDGANNTIIVVYNAMSLSQQYTLKVGPTGKTFTGKAAGWAHVLYSGAPLNGPISAAIVFPAGHQAGNLVVGNTLDPAGKNLLLEFSPAGKLLATVNVDKGAAGALFGMSGNSIGDVTTTQFYFNDDNANNVQMLEK